jgi:hypothetical protein
MPARGWFEIVDIYNSFILQPILNLLEVNNLNPPLSYYTKNNTQKFVRFPPN